MRSSKTGPPHSARQEAGFQLDKMQHGEEPDDWKPMSSVGAGAKEIRIRDAAGAFRLMMYVTKLADAIYVLHCFQKKTRETRQEDMELARKRFKELMKERRS